MNRLGLTAFVLSSGLLCAAAHAETPVDAETPPITARLVTPSGKVFELNWTIRTKWVWDKPAGKAPAFGAAERPFLRTTIEVPSRYKVASAKSSNARLRSTHENSIELDIDGQLSELQIHLNDPKNELPADAALVLETADQPAHLIHPNCGPLSLSMLPTGRQDVKILYVAASCDRVTPKDFDLSILYSRDAVISRTNVQKRKNAVLGTEFYVVTRPDPKKLAPPQRLGQVAFRGRNKAAGSPENFYAVQLDPENNLVAPRFSATASLAVSYLSYTESAINVAATEIALTPKISATYWLKPGLIDLSANAYVNALPLTSNVTATSGGTTTAMTNDTPRFFGINGRSGIQTRLARDFFMKFSLGWYVWGMLVPQADYGATYVAGPQALLSFNGRTKGDHGYGFYFKFAPISDNPAQISFTSRELAGGLSYEVSRPGIRHPLSVSLDMAQATIIPSSVPNQLSLLSTSLNFNYSL